MKNSALGLVVLLLCNHCIGAEIKGVSVFVTHEQGQRVTGCNDYCHLYELDKADNLLQSYFGELPSNEEEAYLMTMEKINSPDWKQLEYEVIEAQKTVIKAFELGVKKYPAIVINDTFVSYGSLDVAGIMAEFLRREANDEN
ncbi:TIGR03757 family integrating conjugative element protein [Orbus sturtevantii]|uniref:TIGR03757 family integrating conjugative element protein n=1 Tax=Orbus sturtevantii TaxID=3074109 RepID=UPI00370D2D62